MGSKRRRFTADPQRVPDEHGGTAPGVDKPPVAAQPRRRSLPLLVTAAGTFLAWFAALVWLALHG